MERETEKMTVKEANEIVKQNRECCDRLLKGECDRFHCVVCEKDNFEKSQEVRQMTFRSLEAWEKVIEEIKDNTTYIPIDSEGTIAPYINPNGVIHIINKHLSEVENET